MRFLALCRAGLRKLFVSKHRTSLAGVFLFILVLGLIGPTNVIHAQAWTSYAESFAETIVLMLTTLLQGLTSAIAYLALSLIEMIVVPILQYNSFSTSETIDLGWSLVRDVVNMFVILVLLVIAIATIVGYEKVSWQKNLPQFLLAVVLVNFSRTICGFLIDISQVIMFTFVNALLDVAAGNFATFLSLDLYGRYSLGAYVNTDHGNAEPITAMMQLGAAYLQFVIYGVIAVVLLILALAYIWRIVLLWVLVILSPLTFFSWGLGGMFKFAAGMGGDWWKKFTAALTMGPMLTFFLWLSLAIGSGDIVAVENFRQAPTSSWVTLEMFETSNLLGTFLALVLLVVGMQQSAAAANAMGGLAKKYLGDEKSGQNLVKGALGWAGGYSGARLGAKGLGKAAGLGISAGQAIGTQIPYVGGMVGRAVVNASGAVQQRTEKFAKSGKEDAKKRVDAMTSDQKAAHLAMLASGRTGAIGVSTKDDISALQTDFAINAATRKKASETMTDSQYAQMSHEALRFGHAHINDMDDAQKDKFAKFKTERAHDLNAVIGAGELQKHIQSDKFSAKDLSAEAVANAGVMAALNAKIVRKGVSVGDELRQGIHGVGLRTASGLAPAAPVYNASRANGRASLSGAAVATEAIINNIALKRIRVDELTATDFSATNGDNLTRALLQSEKSASGISDTAAQADYLTRAATLAAIPMGGPGALTLKQRAFHDNQSIATATAATLPAVMTSTFGVGATFDTDRARQALLQRPEYADHFETLVAAGDVGAQDAVAGSMTADRIESFLLQHQNSSNPAEQHHVEAIIRTLVAAVNGAVGRVPSHTPAGAPLKLRDYDLGLSDIHRRLRSVAPQLGIAPPLPRA